MLEVHLCLEFDCCSCQQRIQVTVKCTGKGLAAGRGGLATVCVPCPTCGQLNKIYFEPNGSIWDVEPMTTGPRCVPVPSLN
ncbi:MAG: hypothetical protein NZ700_07800 [Gemmataceae bacterium]|nr:hypothetical protein [Gemmataceae bacterium]MDW8263852.1 hypothetical protein [Gemmataceae bacterium]